MVSQRRCLLVHDIYYYVLNVQGDVVGLLNAAGELVVEYEYDPWGMEPHGTGSLGHCLYQQAVLQLKRSKKPVVSYSFVFLYVILL